jgi:hypothetical protein
MELVRSYDSIRFGLPRTRGGSAPALVFSRACSAFTHVTACMLAESPMRPSTPKASAASLPPPLLRLLPGGANQFPGGFNSRCGPPPFTAHPSMRNQDLGKLRKYNSPSHLQFEGRELTLKHLVFLPGRTGKLFADFIAALPPSLIATTVSYPTDRFLSCAHLQPFVPPIPPPPSFSRTR